MKLSTILVSITAAAFCLLDISSAKPVGLAARAAPSNKVLVGYFPNWLYGRYTPSKIDFSKYTHVYYAFAVQNTDTTPTWQDSGVFDDYVQYGFPKLISLAHAAGTKVMASVGGWSGSTQFSPMAASESKRAAWIKWNIDFITKYNTDGVDIDWEYPNGVGPGCNAVSNDDVANLQTLIKELRTALNSNFPNDYKEITMAVHNTPFGGATPVTDVSGFVPYVDRFHVMTFDVNGAWNSTSGPNAPLHNTPGWGYPAGLVEGIESWKAAGVPYNKMAAGIPFYGRSQTLLVSDIPTTQYNPAVASNPPKGDSLDGPWTNPYCSKESSSFSGVWRWTNMRSEGILSSPTTAASPWIRNFDKHTQTPWLYNPSTKVFISYDDPSSLQIKTQYALNTGLAGFFVWSIEQDNGELLAAIAPILSNNPSPTPITSTLSSSPSSSSSSSVTTIISRTTSSNAPTSTSSTNCSSNPPWSPSLVYTGGTTVSYNGKIYKAQWWTQNERPTDNPWGVWKLIGSCT
ncbi:glycoside hydrolase superfamily [Cokeromyces recurvatus]|uniref:glycoside hydrolase superfamily n=1 Tax=Cokeromyces recurvatus TaxID=90255 RepID=UPI0022200458|nr:glycoside hydrolase superfamily [Cokeromyces recurvatus]KAI7901639.1 glycoside hydrolase superfamily [Cokeromyces recurvatus]